jgi:hypothetical protein
MIKRMKMKRKKRKRSKIRSRSRLRMRRMMRIWMMGKKLEQLAMERS